MKQDILLHRLWQAPYYATPLNNNELEVQRDKDGRALFLAVLFFIFLVLGNIMFQLGPPVGVILYNLMCLAFIALGLFVYTSTPYYYFSNADKTITITAKFRKTKIIHYDEIRFIRMKTRSSEGSSRASFLFVVEAESGNSKPEFLFTYQYIAASNADVHYNNRYRTQLEKAVKLTHYIAEFIGKECTIEDLYYQESSGVLH